MDKNVIRNCIENSYRKFIEKAFITAVENSITGGATDSSANTRFNNAVKTATKLKEEILKGYT